MKANLIIHCAACGETEVIIACKPPSDDYKVYCSCCDTVLANIHTYGITFLGDEKEDDHAHPTE